MSGFDLKNLEKVIAGRAKVARHGDLYEVNGEVVFPLEDDVYIGLVSSDRWVRGDRLKSLNRYCAKAVNVPTAGTYQFRDYQTGLFMSAYFALGWNDIVVGSPLRNNNATNFTGGLLDTTYILERRLY